MAEGVHLSRVRVHVQVMHVPGSADPESDAASDAALTLVHLRG